MTNKVIFGIFIRFGRLNREVSVLSHPARLLLLSTVLLLASCSQAGPAPDTNVTTPNTLVSTPISEFHLEEEPVEVSLWELAESPNCELPCWWGAVPGQTSENELNQEWARIFSASSLSRPGLVQDGMFPGYQKCLRMSMARERQRY